MSLKSPIEKDSSSKQWLIGPNLPLLGPIRRILSHVTASGYIFRSLSDVSYSDECRTKKAFKYVKRMLPLFRAVVKIYYREVM